MKQRPHISEVTLLAVRSRGPGGQNVNKVSSAAILKWDYFSSASFTETEKRRIGIKLKNLINSSNEVVLRSDEYRDLPRNKERAYEKLVQYIEKALFKPKPRKKTKPSRSQKAKRLDAKTKRSVAKKLRQKVKDF